ncbi:hypothetical protein NEAUS04_0079 [Nematocida ausubeli]|uniref:rRNA-processing protein FYV7 n=1 Tax=Nematocida ausubeli (strain ATCC PRA-371 / ERTm2) TaxID=1913371 RepID=A0A086J082_NEMA1|nr:uncharacterized protein NESG_02329 [Nematocida ausubeli]KAI5134443.1 hypothetical protein NEAUS06_1083 [Nematocida ausubeli]KAI5136348.1 hypothetical protein NEAUS07_1592 [Nematocida ausubeli]KAI5160682.1 hypothetical protein NEAUS04_0079 [Nematocida ausubeli]KAI5161935.1 hypothetical protein NEAUS03_1840 [Nematocida ausubeli]KFG25550.1 hypothetical protein NESG_02329 [Nematocida ausubeli]
MAWKSQTQYRKQKEEEMTDRRRDEDMRKAFADENIEHLPNVSSKTKKQSVLEDIHKENLRKREERQNEIEKINKIREKKQREKEDWKRKFNHRTKKGQIPLGPRINYLYKKIQELKKNN